MTQEYINELHDELADKTVKYHLVMQFLKASAQVLLYYDTQCKLEGLSGILHHLPDQIINEMFGYDNMEGMTMNNFAKNAKEAFKAVRDSELEALKKEKAEVIEFLKKARGVVLLGDAVFKQKNGKGILHLLPEDILKKVFPKENQ
jgi:hypothetical protein